MISDSSRGDGRKRHHLKPLPTRQEFLLRFIRALSGAALLLLLGMGIGVIGYRFIVGLSWLDAVLNAAMILAGEGPVNPTSTAAGKLFASFYALFSGLVFVTVTALLVAPILRRTLHRFHLDNLIDDSPVTDMENQKRE